ncbi:MAG TPA: PA14 domain-containing protein [Tepidisphaeraceae bacterium]|jgi:regulation of enolase protein 1 (concanavalin A-like superfamily)|nr:PA14 domain-containing protein [Tepidisphaeraceae bacterium]
MSRTRPFIVAILTVLLALPGARADVLRTLDGKVYEGQIKFDTGDMLTMQPTSGSAVRVKLADVLSASFRASVPTQRAEVADREPIRAPWAPREIGKPPAGGVKRTATRVTLQAGTVTDTSDSVPFFGRPVKGNFELVLRITDISAATAAAGVMLRGGPEPDALTFYAAIGGVDGSMTTRSGERHVRPANGQAARKSDLPRISAPQWMRLTREGDFIEVGTSTDGNDWKVFATERLDLPENVLIGMACTVRAPSGDKKPSKDAPPVATPHATFESLRLVEAAQVATTGLRGQYYSTEKFTEPKIARVDPSLDHNWGTNAPADGLPVDNFSVRWRGRLRVPLTGKYRFHASADDSVVVWVNGNRLLERSGSSREITLRSGQSVAIRVDYFEKVREANVKLEWESEKVPRQVIPSRFLIPAERDDDGESENGLRAEYFADATLSNLHLVRTDSEVNFQQPNSPADDGLNLFSVRWTGMLVPPASGRYTFYTLSDDGVRLWINNKQLIDNWQMNPGVEDSGVIQLKANEPVPIRMESFNGAGGWIARLMWDGPDIDKQIIPGERFQTPGEEVDTRILTRDGSELTGITLEQMDDTTMRFKRADDETLSLPTARVARLSLRPLTSSLLEHIPGGSFGVLLTNGDFFDGQVEGLKGDRLTVNSLIFGPRTFDLRKEVAALVLQDARPEPAEYVVKTVDGSIYMADEVAVDGGKLIVTDRAAGKVTVAADTVRDIAYAGERVASLAELSPEVSGGAMRLDGTPVGVPVRLFDYTPTRSIGLSPGTTVTYALDGKYKTLLATAGVPAALLPTGGLLFTATADGKEIFRSPALTSLSDSLPVSLKLDKVNRLTLKVEPADPANAVALPGVWGDPLLAKP